MFYVVEKLLNVLSLENTSPAPTAIIHAICVYTEVDTTLSSKIIQRSNGRSSPAPSSEIQQASFFYVNFCALCPWLCLPVAVQHCAGERRARVVAASYVRRDRS